MPRTCEICGGKHYAKNRCKLHYRMPSRTSSLIEKCVEAVEELSFAQIKIRNHINNAKPKVGDIIETNEGTMRVVDIKPSWENKPIVSKGGKAIPFMSEKHKKRLAEYRVKRDHYFKSHPVCEFPSCGSREITLHHMKGRIGKDLTDDRYFKSLCHTHHRFVEENPTEALKMGLSKKRLDK